MTETKFAGYVLTPTADPDWIVSVDGYDPLRENSVESRFAISNGFLGIRGARSMTRGERWIVPARTYVAGLFDGAGHAPTELVPAADWVRVRIFGGRQSAAAPSKRDVVA